MSVRAVRNNNPGNINAGPHWQGLMPVSAMTPEQKSETRFAVFMAPKWGFRALATVLLNYERLYGLNTVEKIIARWAPFAENDTAAYIKAVANALNVAPDDLINVHNLPTLIWLCEAISVHECGGWKFDRKELAAGVEAALRV